MQREQTYSKNGKQTLQESDRSLKSTFENAAVGIAHIGLDGTFLRANSRYCALTGYSFEELKKKKVQDLTPPEEWAMEVRLNEKLHRGEIDHFVVEKRYLRKDGGVIWIELTRSMQRDPLGRPEHYIGIAQDISKRRRLQDELGRLNKDLERLAARRTRDLERTVERLRTAEGELRERTRILEAFFQYTITPLAILDRDFRFIRVNEAYAGAGGRTPDFFMGKNLFDLYPDARNRAIFEGVVRSRKPLHAYAMPFVYPDDPGRGVTYWNWRLTPLLDEEGRVAFLIFSLEDITEQQRTMKKLKEHSRRLHQMTLELSQAEDRERRRLSEVLHDDLQQMLAAAKFHTELLGRRTDDDAQATEDAARRIGGILSEAIEISRNLSHELSPPGLSQGDLCRAVEWLAAQSAPKYGLDVVLEDCHKIEVASEAKRSFIYRAAQELLFNVAKHAGVRQARVRLRQRRGGKTCLTVADSGNGFDPGGLPESRGFGLRAIEERAGLLGGRLRVRSAPGKGCVFRVKL